MRCTADFALPADCTAGFQVLVSDVTGASSTGFALFIEDRPARHHCRGWVDSGSPGRSLKVRVPSGLRVPALRNRVSGVPRLATKLGREFAYAGKC